MEALKTRLDGILTYAIPVQRFNQLSQQANWQLVIKLVRYIPKLRATTPKIVGPTILGVIASVLAVVCKRIQQRPGILGPTMHRGRDTTHMTLETARVQCACVGPTMLEELCKRIQHCCATLRRPRNKRNVGSYWLKSLTGFNLRNKSVCTGL